MSERLLDISYSIQKVIPNADMNVLLELLESMDKAISMVIGEEATPVKLEWVLKETTIQRYNRVGSEGLASENIDVLGMTYVEDILGQYQKYFDIYLSSKSEHTSKRFLRMY